MGRVININSGAKLRNTALRNMALALRRMAGGELTDKDRKDLGAFLVLSLKEIHQTIDQAACAWEKRDYWIKADHFRMEWRWVERLNTVLDQHLQNDDMAGFAAAAGELAGKLGSIDPPKRIPQPLPWVGAWDKLLLLSAKKSITR